jgi:hypothetical protein
LLAGIILWDGWVVNVRPSTTEDRACHQREGTEATSNGRPAEWGRRQTDVAPGGDPNQVAYSLSLSWGMWTEPTAIVPLMLSVIEGPGGWELGANGTIVMVVF